MANRQPRKPVRQGGGAGRRKPSAAVPPLGPLDLGSGVGSRFSEAITREPDLGGGLPRAPFPVIAQTPSEIRRRAAQKDEANRRKGAANNVTGYVAPASPRLNGLPTAAELMVNSDLEDRLPTAAELLSSGQEFGELREQAEGTYIFPQVSPTRTIDPFRPRTLEAGYERETRTLRVRFRDGTPWEYYDVSPEEWQQFKRVRSPGRFINRRLNAHDYQRGNF